jgi:RNA polymerase sigma-54 factor
MVGFSLNQTVQTKQTQQLKLTPQLRQGIELIQMTTLEVETWLHHKIQENPFLEIQEEPDDEVVEIVDKLGVEQNQWDQIESVASDSAGENLDDDHQFDAEVCAWSSEVVKGHFEGDEEPSFPDVSAQKSLVDVLMEQVQWLDLGSVEHEVVEYLIGNLNDDGLLEDTLEDLAGALSQNEEHIDMLLPLFEDGLRILQTLEPAGVAARNLTECLCLQVERGDTGLPTKKLAKQLLEQENFKALVRPHLLELCQRYDVDQQLMASALQLIRTLDPKPVSRLGLGGDTVYVTPDLRSFQTRLGVWKVVMRDGALPKVSVNTEYVCLINPKDKQKKQEGDMGQWVQEAKQVVRQLEQRQNTLLLVGQEIARRQQAFFAKGIRALKPMVLKDVAEEIDVHESTVSRLVNGKYLQTPHGVFELKSLFCSGFSAQMEASDDVPQVSSATIQGLILDLVKSENELKPFSDQKIADWLKREHQLDVARRTVAKYRDVLGIPAASDRKVRDAVVA